MSELATEDVEVDAMHPSSWGIRLRRRRQRFGLTQTELAAAASGAFPGVYLDQGKVSLIEGGRRRPTEDQKVALARALDTKVATLFPYPDDV